VRHACANSWKQLTLAFSSEICLLVYAWRRVYQMFVVIRLIPHLMRGSASRADTWASSSIEFAADAISSMPCRVCTTPVLRGTTCNPTSSCLTIIIYTLIDITLQDFVVAWEC
jgi:hypothetical protein